MQRLLVSILFLVACNNVTAQNFSNKGKEFWVGYGHHQFMEPGQPNSQEMVIYLSAEQAATVVVSINGTSWTRTYNVPANTVIATEYLPKIGVDDCRLYSVPPSFGGTGGEGVFNRGINIKSDTPIVAYAHTFGSASSGATMLMPVDTWGNLYFTLNSRQTYANNCFSWAYCVAQENNTVIEITPSVETRTLRPAGVPFTVTLNKGQIYQIIGNNPTGGSTALEISGSKFKSVANASGVCPPIAVFSGSSRTTNPIGCGSGGGDNDNQQCFPTKTWGKTYLTAPTSRSTAANQFHTNSYKVLVKDPTTVVRRNGVVLTGLTNNYYFFESGNADIIEGDKPIMVAQFMTGGGCLGGGVGDPEMMYISPIEQGIKRIAFYRNTRESITTNYLTLIIPTNGIPSLRIDGSPAYDHSYPHPQKPGYSVVVKRWTSAQAQATAFSDSAFNAITYGLGSVESYGYNAGTFLKNLNVIGTVRNPLDTSAVKTHEFTCQNNEVKLFANIIYKPTNIIWHLSQVGPQISPNTDITVSSPVAIDSNYYYGVKYYRYQCPGLYTFSDTGTFQIPITCTHPSIENCLFSEKIFFDVIVKPRPRVDFTFSPLVVNCQLDTATFTGITPTLNGYNVQQYKWTFPGSILDSGQIVKRVLPAGINNVKLAIVTTEGCAWDTTKPITVLPKPSAGFTITPPLVCENGNVTFTDTSGVVGAGPGYNWYWDFGNGVIVNSPTSVNQTAVYNTYGTYTIKHVVSTSATCFSDTVVKTITIFAKPRVNFTFPVTCLAPNGEVQFTNATTVPDGQTFASYAWDFADPNANAGNPNTSSAINPTHQFLEGTYGVKLTVTSQQGCIKDTTINVPVKIKPSLSFTALSSACQNVAAFSIANATVTNGVTGTGIYSGPGTSATGIFTPSVAGVGTHTIWYIFTTLTGCSDSVSQTILVKAKPVVSYTYPLGGCLPPNGLAQFNGAASLADAQTVSTWAWNFNDPNANAGNPNTSGLQNPTHNFTANGIYNVLLTVTSSGGCTGDTTIALNFNIKPSLNYPPLASVCQNVGGTISVATATVTNGATGTGTYLGPGTTTAGIFTPAIAGVGNHTIWYKFVTPNGCSDSVSQTILVKAKPVVSYTYPLGGCLPPNGLAQFNGAASLADAQTVSTWAWNFNDPNANAGNPNTSGLQNPTHNFTANGIYNVSLTVTSSGGCTGDTTIALNFNIKPSLNYPPLASVCQNVGGTISVATATVTNGATGTGTYLGPGTTTAGVFTPAIAGVGNHTIWYKFVTPNGCSDSVSQTILVKAKPVVSYTYPLGGCLPPNGLAQFNGAASLADAQTVSTWAWNFNDPNANAGNPNTSGLQNPTHNFTANGIYNVMLTVTSSGGCTGDTTIALNFNIKPSLNYPPLNSVCQNVGGTISVATATVTNGATGTGTYLGPGTTTAGVFTPSIAGVGNHTIWYKFVTPNGCSDSVSQTILVKAKPVVSYTYPLGGCLPPNGLAQFNGAASLADAQTVSTWAWNFNDPNANAGNPNTSGLQNPTHNFTANGIYNVLLTVTSSGGCTGDTTIPLNFNIKPSLNYPPLNPVCQSVAGSISVATATVTNGATGTGTYSGPGTTSAGQFSPSIAGAGVHTIWYKFVTPNGCADSLSQTIAVDPKPTAQFNAIAPVCLGNTVTFTDASSISSGTISEWRWTFGDGNTANNNNGNVFNYTYGTSNNFTAKLVTLSSNGCVSDTFSRTVIINPIPVADFINTASVCMPGGVVSFTNQSTLANNGSMTYSWNFGDGSPLSSSTSPSHVYAAINTYTISLTATSAAGCSHQVNKTFSGFFEKPDAAFLPIPAEVCQGKSNTFNDLSTDPGGSTITNWNWSFGDGATSSIQNPTKLYAQAGNYPVTLTVTNAVGCVSTVFSLPVTVHLQPVVDAGPSFVVPQGNSVTFNPTVNNPGFVFSWSPTTGLSSGGVMSPVLIANSDQVYTLTVTGQGGCTASDFLTVKVLKKVNIPNAFSPNGDGVNDKWEIENLFDYSDCDVQIFNRYGQRIYQSKGYTNPWDGTISGKPMPLATYYYVIDLKNGLQKLNGSVTIVR